MPDQLLQTDGSANGTFAAPHITQPSPPSSHSGDVSPPVTSPPYWVQSHSRSISNISVESIVPGAIVLQDNTEGVNDKSRACWARGVHIDDYVVVNGNLTGLGAFVVWNITIETMNASS